jgi:solute carrier family 25 aspartate/glutamate transporter 12/13
MESLMASGLIRRARCQTSTQPLGTIGYLKRGDGDKLKAVFEKYASANVDGVQYMTDEDFVVKFLKLFPESGFNKHSVNLLCGILDQSKDGLISFEEFHNFEGRLCLPDALYRTAFQLFDTDGSGTVSFSEFCEVIKQTSLYRNIPFPLETSDFVKLYFGREKKRVVTYAEFSQFLHDFHDEYAQVAFKAKDSDGSGFISSKDFFDIMISIKSHLLTDPVKANLVGAVQGTQVSYPLFVAFISLLSNIELIKKIYLNATNGSRTVEITKEEFLHSAQMMSQITPLEIDILFTLCDLLHQTG